MGWWRYLSTHASQVQSPPPLGTPTRCWAMSNVTNGGTAKWPNGNKEVARSEPRTLVHNGVGGGPESNGQGKEAAAIEQQPEVTSPNPGTRRSGQRAAGGSAQSPVTSSENVGARQVAWAWSPG